MSGCRRITPVAEHGTSSSARSKGRPSHQAFGTPTSPAQTSACNRHHALDQQLCRRLLLNLDRRQGNEIVVTQERIADMLGVRREGVTGAALKLQKAGLIQYRRGRIVILDRAGLEGRSCECYAVVGRAYDRLLRDAGSRRLASDSRGRASISPIAPMLATA